jgi:hypothetical protein
MELVIPLASFPSPKRPFGAHALLSSPPALCFLLSGRKDAMRQACFIKVGYSEIFGGLMKKLASYRATCYNSTAVVSSQSLSPYLQVREQFFRKKE